MKPSLLYKRDFYAGGLMVLFGLVAAIKGPQYGMGNLMHMGPGYMPTALGVLLIILGVTISGTAATKHDPEEERILPEHPEWFAWACILAGPLAFIVFGHNFGLGPAVFACVFVSALGDRDVTFRSASILSIVVTAFGCALFSALLKVPLPVFKSTIIAAVSIFYTVALLSYFVFRPLMSGILISLAIAIVIPTLYLIGLFFFPQPATFFLAGVLSFWWFKQFPKETLTSVFAVSIPGNFAVSYISLWIAKFLLFYSTLVSFLVFIMVATAIGVIVYVATTQRLFATEVGGVKGVIGPHLQRAERLMPIALAIVVAVSAISLAYLFDLPGLFQRGLW